jgi:hypothetical protein
MDTILVEPKDGDGRLLSWTEATIADSDPKLPPGCVKVTRTGGSEDCWGRGRKAGMSI